MRKWTGRGHLRAAQLELKALALGFWPLVLTVLHGLLPDPPSPESPTETFAAPAEVRHFTDGSFPPGFVLQLFSHTQLRTTDSKDSSKDGKAAAEGLPRPENPSPGEPSGGAVGKLSP